MINPGLGFRVALSSQYTRDKISREGLGGAKEEEETSGLTDALVETMLKNPDPKFQVGELCTGHLR